MNMLLQQIFKSKIKEERVLQDVGMDEFKKAKEGVDQYTDSLSPCIGVGFYNTNSNESYLLHTPDPEDFGLEKKIKLVKEDFKDDPIKVVVAGGVFYRFDSSNDINKAGRDYAKKIILNEFEDVKFAFGDNIIHIDKRKKEIITGKGVLKHSNLRK